MQNQREREFFVNPIPVIADPDDLYQSRFVQTVSVVSIGRKGWLKFSFTRISILLPIFLGLTEFSKLIILSFCGLLMLLQKLLLLLKCLGLYKAHEGEVATVL